MEWERLAELARRERELVGGERWDELLGLQAERQRLIDALPSPPPAEAALALNEALVQSRATQAALHEALSRTERMLGALRRGRRVVSAYGVARGAGVELTA